MKILFLGNPSNLLTETYNQLSAFFPIKTVGFDKEEIFKQLKELGAEVVLVSLKEATGEQLLLAELIKLDPQWNYVKVIVIGFSYEVNNQQKIVNTMADKVLVFPIPKEKLIEEICEAGNIPNPLDQENALYLSSQKEKRHVLVVDDDPRMLRAVKSWLEATYKVTIVNSGKMALDFLGKQVPDVILLDYEMPGQNGPETLEAIRKNEQLRNLPVFFLTGVSDREKVKTAASLKPQGYILKGVSREELLMKLNEFFSIQQ